MAQGFFPISATLACYLLLASSGQGGRHGAAGPPPPGRRGAASPTPASHARPEIQIRARAARELKQTTQTAASIYEVRTLRRLWAAFHDCGGVINLTNMVQVITSTSTLSILAQAVDIVGLDALLTCVTVPPVGDGNATCRQLSLTSLLPDSLPCSDSTQELTMFAPTNDGINWTLEALNITVTGYTTTAVAAPCDSHTFFCSAH